ncbi:HRDC domain-containing protein [Pedobacter nyackensis]|uniref:Helicase n=1 Tax=Pedobacter nyackensis TaxID=475255 RepID=A0A1W2A0B1_9SPHI|nr:HRDC domain-containing protein [Pedobacter nyackensis]SMC54046.1 Helicase [Pedobacter nyackensis]
MTTDDLDPIHKQVISFIENTTKPIFVTGKAGTGKTTFLHYLKSSITKNLAVIAPTAIAALNAGGVTIHSFFQLPLGPLEPLDFIDNENILKLPALSGEKRSLLIALELLIIDEISMVRADTIDRIDLSLRMARGISVPFGGVQIIMFGDPYQLPPIFQNDWPILRRYYNSPYFFSSIVFTSVAMITFELTKVHRQSDPFFLSLLNNIRIGKVDSQLLGKLNEHIFLPSEDLSDEYITIATHNHIVNEINEKHLNELPGEIYSHIARIKGEFPKEAYPTDFELRLKVGARVIFIKNDSSGNKLFYNGRVANILSIEDTNIRVRFHDDNSELTISPEVWSNQKYTINDVSNSIKESTIGTFSQYPLKLSWAITVHKSQGLTFEKAAIDIDAAFAPGQAYVALSRCRSLEGIILRAPVREESILNDPKIHDFMSQMKLASLSNEQLDIYKMKEQYLSVKELLDFSYFSCQWERLNSLVDMDFETPQENLKDLLLQIKIVVEKQVDSVARQFTNREFNTLDQSLPLSHHPIFLVRLKKASTYFEEKLKGLHELAQNLLNYPLNSTNSNLFFKYYNSFISVCLSKIAGFESNFDEPAIYETVKRMQDAMLNYVSVHSFYSLPETKKKSIQNPLVFDELLNWRKDLAHKRSVAEYIIISEKLCIKIASKLPNSLQELGAINGIGQDKAAELGDDILKIVRKFTGKNNLF